MRILEEENDKLRENVSKMSARYQRILEFATENKVNLDDMTYQISPGERPSD